MDAYQAIVERRSIRQFDGRPVPREAVDMLLRVGCLAPAPHHTRPWRYVVLETPEARLRLAEAMGEAWRLDLERDAVQPEKIDALLARSRRQIEDAPALVLACVVGAGLRQWPDERRKLAESRMATQSMGCALENILVAAHAGGLAGYWISAPLFCPDAVRDGLDLPPEYEAQALIAIGYPSPDVELRPRAEPDLADLVLSR